MSGRTHRSSGASRSVAGAILRASAHVGTMAVVVKGAALCKELLVARDFGAGDDYDAFLVSYALLAFGITICSQGLASSLVPKYVEIRDNEGGDAAKELLGNALCIGAALLVAAAGVLAILAPSALALIGGGFDDTSVALAIRLFYAILIALPIAGLTAILAGVVNTTGRFRAVAIAPVATPLATVVALLAAGDALGVTVLAVGLVVGVVIEGLIILRLATGAGLLGRIRWVGMTPATRAVIHQYWPMVLGAMILGLTPLIDSAMAASLGNGSVARLTYGYKIVGPLLAIGGLAVGTAALPIISGLTAQRDWAGTRRSFYRLTMSTLALSVPLCVVLVAFAEPMVRLLFERGEFTPEDTAVVARVQMMFAARLPLVAVTSVVVRFISALRANRVLLFGNIISVTVNVTMNYVLMSRIGVAGIALSTSITGVVATIYLSTMMLRTLAVREQRT